MSFDCRFLGAAEDIGRLGFVLETQGRRFLYDYGIAPDKPPLVPLEAPPIDQFFLTHAHMDHSGMVPWLVGRYEGTLATTSVTAEVSGLMHRDAVKIAHSEGYPEPYSTRDIEATESMYENIRFEEPFPVGELEATFHSAGHIPGAAQIELAGDDGTFVFTGDFYSRPQRLVGAAQPVPCDVLAMETTYAGREHPDRNDVEDEFLAFVEERTDRGGLVVAAAFAVGRAQELALVLADQGYNVWMDGMARKVSTIYNHHPEFLADARFYRRGIGQVKYVHSHHGRKVALREADVIITTSGMLEGGPILFYLRELRNDPDSGLALTGYQVRGTNGRRLLDTGEIDLDPRDPGKQIAKVEMPIKQFDFSAHAGHSDMVDFARETGADDIILFHGDNREALAEDLQDFATVHMPERGERFTVG